MEELSKGTLDIVSLTAKCIKEILKRKGADLRYLYSHGDLVAKLLPYNIVGGIVPVAYIKPRALTQAEKKKKCDWLGGSLQRRFDREYKQKFLL